MQVLLLIPRCVTARYISVITVLIRDVRLRKAGSSHATHLFFTQACDLIYYIHSENLSPDSSGRVLENIRPFKTLSPIKIQVPINSAVLPNNSFKAEDILKLTLTRSEKSISGCLQYLFLKVQGKCCGEPGYDIPVSTGSWKQLDKSKKIKKKKNHIVICIRYTVVFFFNDQIQKFNQYFMKNM